jgi:hypothetical protein
MSKIKEATFEQTSEKRDTTMNTLIPTNKFVTDGWDDAADENSGRVIKGELLKFSDWNWSRGKEGVKVEEGKTLVAVGLTSAWVRWAGGKPAEYKLKEPHRRLPDRNDLGDLDEREWEAGPDGKARDPWQNTRFVYLIDPLTAEAFTFSTSSWGGRGAVRGKADMKRER